MNHRLPHVNGVEAERGRWLQSKKGDVNITVTFENPFDQKSSQWIFDRTNNRQQDMLGTIIHKKGIIIWKECLLKLFMIHSLLQYYSPVKKADWVLEMTGEWIRWMNHDLLWTLWIIRYTLDHSKESGTCTISKDFTLHDIIIYKEYLSVHRGAALDLLLSGHCFSASSFPVDSCSDRRSRRRSWSSRRCSLRCEQIPNQMFGPVQSGQREALTFNHTNSMFT